jgi:hypothetical protein
VGVHQWGYAGKMLIADLVPGRPKRVENPHYPQRVPYGHRVRQQAETACLIHDLLGVAGTKLATVVVIRVCFLRAAMAATVEYTSPIWKS